MAEKEIRELEVTKVERKRKNNFSVNKITVITEDVRKNHEIIQSKLTNSMTNKRRTETWDEITKDVNIKFIKASLNFLYFERRRPPDEFLLFLC